MEQIVEFFNTLAGQIIAQLVGFAAMTVGILSYQRKRRISILIFQLVGNCLWGTQYLMLGCYAGAMQNIIAIARGIIFSQRGKRRWADSPVTVVIIMVLFLVLGIFTVDLEGYWVFVSVAAMMLQTVGIYATKEKTVRILFLCACPLWLIYSIHAQSIAGIVSECCSIFSIFLALWRFRQRKQENALLSDDGSRGEADCVSEAEQDALNV